MKQRFETEELEIEIEVTEEEIDKNNAKNIVYQDKYIKLIPEEIKKHKDLILQKVIKEILQDKIKHKEEIEPRIIELSYNMKTNLNLVPKVLKYCGIGLVILVIYLIVFK